MFTQNQDVDIEAIKAELMAECQAIIEFYAQVDQKVRARFFPDPVAWEAVESLSVETYEKVMEYCRYYLGCEILNYRPMEREAFQMLPAADRTEFSERAYRL